MNKLVARIKKRKVTFIEKKPDLIDLDQQFNVSKEAEMIEISENLQKAIKYNYNQIQKLNSQLAESNVTMLTEEYQAILSEKDQYRDLYTHLVKSRMVISI